MSLSKKEKLLAQSEAVKDCAKHLERKIKREQKYLEHEQQDARHFGIFEDCGQFYVDKVKERETRIKTLIEEKISLEKYAKKLKHQAEEI